MILGKIVEFFKLVSKEGVYFGGVEKEVVCLVGYIGFNIGMIF